MGSLFGETTVETAYVCLCLISAILGVISSIFCILLMYQMKSIRKTGHIELLLYMTVYQFIYELFFFTISVDVGSALVKSISWGIAIPSGTMSVGYSNWMVFVAWYIVYFKKPFDVVSNMNMMTSICATPTIIETILYWYCDVSYRSCVAIVINNIYDILRTTSIGINVALILSIAWELGFFNSESASHKDEKYLAIRTCVMRLILYPVAQGFSRIGFMWYHTAYGAYVTFDNMTIDKIFCLMILGLTAGSISVAYLLIFLFMQPHAYDHFLALLRCQTHIEIKTESETENTADEETVVENVAARHQTSQKNSISTIATTRKTVVSSGRQSEYQINRESFRFSFQDLRTDDEIMGIIEAELDLDGLESMFAPSSNASISMQPLGTPTRNILHDEESLRGSDGTR